MIYARVAFAMLVVFTIRTVFYASGLLSALAVDVHPVNGFLGVFGAVYGIVVAFMLFVVWEQFNRVQTAIINEAAQLEDLCRITSCFSDANLLKHLKTGLREYIGICIRSEAEQFAQRKTSAPADEQFGKIARILRGLEPVTTKDTLLYDDVFRVFSSLSEIRNERISMSTTRIPATMWRLIVFASVLLVLGFGLLHFHNLLIGAVITAAVAGFVVFLLSVVSDMDNPFSGSWNISYSAMNTASAHISTM